jgi:RNA polymerase sigma-70 factor (ECF subfamily)
VGDQWAGGWISFPPDWDAVPEDRLRAPETGTYLQQVVATLPPAQQVIVCLRDLAGCNAAEVCNLCAIGETDQQVLLHRARAKVRRALARYLVGE